ncbi:MAG TPA: NADH-quinone oxidoreductase subunit N [Anaerolineales bacterium]|nr:NADH-quinone oxidoreductase subunit N [Anaerolineales bacterium]HRQ92367.1 NADH-quinone oxidoreductase subunit N [Anaerolineales bacterium]
MFGSITPDMILAILPELSLLVVLTVVFIADLVLPKERNTWLPWITAAGLAATFVATLLFARPVENELVWGGMLRHDLLAYVGKLLFIFTAFVTTLISVKFDKVTGKGEYYFLMLASTIGMTLMAASADVVMLFLAIETTSIPLYVLAGFMTGDNKSTEAGFKYLLFGAMTTAVMLYGFSLLYGFAGTTNLYAMSAAIAAGSVPGPVLVGTVVLVLLGLGFKVAIFPMHFWAPDVYEGAPTPITAFLSTASKAAGFLVLIRVMLASFPQILADWQLMLGVLAVASMFVGNVVALTQKNIKRLLAYSGIAHAGYALLGVVAASELGVASVVYYLLVYVVTNLASFGIVVIVWRAIGSDEIEDYAGLSRRSPMLALVMLLAFLSLAGIPPLGGFIAKVLVFAAAVEANLIWLAVLGVLNSIIGLYYYLIVLKVVYLGQPKSEEPIAVAPAHGVAIVASILLVLLLGVVIAPGFDWALAAAASLF